MRTWSDDFVNKIICIICIKKERQREQGLGEAMMVGYERRADKQLEQSERAARGETEYWKHPF